MNRYYFIRAIVFLVIGILLVAIYGCDSMKCGLRGKINPKTGEKYIGFVCNGDF